MHRHGFLCGSLLVALLLAAVVGWTAPPKVGGTQGDRILNLQQ
jgi:hypothetical protein